MARPHPLDHAPSSCRRHDYDHYLCNLLLPQAVQVTAFALRGFNVEVAQIHDVVTEKQTGLMRIQFWRDLLDSVYKVLINANGVRDIMSTCSL